MPMNAYDCLRNLQRVDLRSSTNSADWPLGQLTMSHCTRQSSSLPCMHHLCIILLMLQSIAQHCQATGGRKCAALVQAMGGPGVASDSKHARLMAGAH